MNLSKPKILVSKCLEFDTCRYNGLSIKDSIIRDGFIINPVINPNNIVDNLDQKHDENNNEKSNESTKSSDLDSLKILSIGTIEITFYIFDKYLFSDKL